MSQAKHIELIGNEEDNFYQLGLRDKNAYDEVNIMIQRLCSRSDIIAKAFKKTSELALSLSNKTQPIHQLELKAYAEGLERSFEKVYSTLLLPEIVSSFNKWMPNLMGVIPGCSSLFVHHKEENTFSHTRILDYAILGPFDQNERTISYNFAKKFKSFSFSTVGLPFPSLTVVNETGLSIALHYKHGDYFNFKGHSIFSIIYQVISYCNSINEVKKFLKNYPSLSHWGLYALDKNGEVASIDLKGQEIYFEKFDLQEFGQLYFNNRSLLKDKHASQLQPYGNYHQCIMRKNSYQEKFQKQDITKLSTEEVLKSFTKLNTNQENFNLDVITPSSIQAVSINFKEDQCFSIKGAAPKFYQGELIHYQSLMNSPNISEVKEKFKLTTFHKGYRYLGEFQSALDLGDVENAFHKIQMSLELCKNQSIEPIIKFYFLVTQYLYESDLKELVYIYKDLVALEKSLPEYLEDHRILFIHRLEKILNYPSIDYSSIIKNDNLKALYLKEIKLKKSILKLLKKLTFPRIESLDIIYSY